MVEPYLSEKYESQMGLFFPIYGKIKSMFQATNQIGYDTVDGRNPAPVDIDISGVSMFIPLFIGFQPSKVVQNFFQPQ